MTAEECFLLDTNTLSDLIRNPAGRVAQRIAEVGTDRICTSLIVVCELRFGALKKGSPKLSQRMDMILDGIEILSLESPMEEAYADIRVVLERAGLPIGPNDLLIAAQALTLRLTVVTHNTNEFSRVPGLSVVNWL